MKSDNSKSRFEDFEPEKTVTEGSSLVYSNHFDTIPEDEINSILNQVQKKLLKSGINLLGLKKGDAVCFRLSDSNTWVGYGKPEINGVVEDIVPNSNKYSPEGAVEIKVKLGEGEIVTKYPNQLERRPFELSLEDASATIKRRYGTE